MHPAFLEGTYTTQFIDQQIAGKKHRELFMFVEEPVFLIAAAIGTSLMVHRATPATTISSASGSATAVRNL